MTASSFKLGAERRARLTTFGEALDQIVTIDIAGRGAIRALHAAARARATGPLTSSAALALAEALTDGGVFVICTGFPVRPWISPAIGETDGPPGAAALAWATALACRALPVILTPPAMTGQAEAAARAFGLVPLPLDQARRAVTGSRPTPAVVVMPFTLDAAAATAEATRLFAELSPRAVAAIEHPGANAKGVYHSSLGVDISAGVTKVEPLFARAQEAGVPTLSFPDMPNEIGLGPLREAAKAASPYAERCQCPCEGGITGASEVDHIVFATAANWGAYAVAAALAVLTDTGRAMISPQQDARAIAATQGAGAIEGVSGSYDPEAGIDGIPTAVSGRIAALIADSARPFIGLDARAPF